MIADAKTAEKKAKIAAAAISNPDGTPLREAGRYSGEIKSERTADTIGVDVLISERSYLDRNGHEVPADEYFNDKKETLERVIVALAHKRGLTEDAVREQLTEKAKKKYKADYGRIW